LVLACFDLIGPDFKTRVTANIVSILAAQVDKAEVERTANRPVVKQEASD
jgi:hypothetical protein